MPIDGLELALPPKGRFEGLYGRLSGEGMLGLQPLEMKGSVSLERPGLLGLQLRQALLEGTYRDRRFQVSGELLPLRVVRWCCRRRVVLMAACRRSWMHAASGPDG